MSIDIDDKAEGEGPIVFCWQVVKDWKFFDNSQGKKLNQALGLSIMEVTKDCRNLYLLEAGTFKDRISGFLVLPSCRRS